MRRLAVADGTRYAVEESGAGSALLLLHGFAGGASSWHGLVPELGRDRRVIAPDLLGHGASDAPVDPARHAVEHQAADLAELLEQLDACPAAVLGYSFGARVALRLALDHPDAVERLVVVSPSAGLGDPAARAERRTADERWAAMLDRGDLLEFVEAWEDQPLFASRRALPDELRTAIRATQLANPPAGLAASLRGAGQGAMEPVLDRLGAIAAPTLVLGGALDPVGAARAAAVADGIPDARLELLPGAGHAPHLEQPADVGALVRAFLAPPPVSPATAQPVRVM